MKKLIEQFETISKDFSNEIAIVDLDAQRKTTYAQLDALRKKVASKIIAMNVEGNAILICLSRSCEYVAAYLGIITAGYAAVPLSLEYPKERVDFIKEDCNCSLVITEDFLSDLDEYEICNFPQLADDKPAHILYTSGSTGRPKGIVHTYKSLSRVVFGPSKIFDIGERRIYASAAAYSFIAFAYDVLVNISFGGTVHIVDENVRKDAKRLAEYYVEHKINIGIISPQVLRIFKCNSPYLKRVVTGSELVSNIYSENYEIINAYGSTETGFISEFLIDKKYDSTPIGKPLDDCKFILCKDGVLSEDNQEGEICVVADVAKEYLNLPEKNKAAFETLPSGERLYHTGDYGRIENGIYHYVSRIDWMVKINGQRVETSEVENLIKEVPSVDNAAVKCFVDDNGQNYLCAYYVENEATDETKIREYLAKKVPAYMIPRFFCKMETLPITITGKLDRMSLNPPSVDDYKKDYEAPKSKNEIAVCDAFSTVLSCGKVGMNDDFFSLGGDSIKALLLVSEIEKALGCQLNPDDILLERTPKNLIKALCFDETEIINKAEEKDIYLLTESQKGVYFECMENPLSTVYNIPFAIELPKTTDIAEFISAVKSVASTHPAIFTTVSLYNGEPAMHIGENICEVAQTERSHREAINDFVKPFDLENGPLYRFEICNENGKYLFLIDIHHIVFDGTSFNILLKQITDCYNGNAIENEKISLFDYSEKEKEIKSSEQYKNAQNYFKALLDGREFNCDIISDVKKKLDTVGSVNALSNDELNHNAVEHFTRKLGITESTLFTSAFAYALSVFAGTDEVCFTTVNNGRHIDTLNETVGMFVKTLPLCFDIPKNNSIKDFLVKAQKEIYSAMKHDIISFGELVAQYGVNSKISFVYQSKLLSEFNIENTSIIPEELPVNGCQSDILCMMLKTDNAYELRIKFKKSLYSEELIASICETFFEIVSGMLHSEKLNEISLIPSHQIEKLNKINNTEFAYNEQDTINSLFENFVSKNSDKNVLVYGDKKYTYKDFDRITNSLASYVYNNIGSDKFVAVLAPRNDLAVISAWGIIKSSNAFQMLDPTYPADRLNYMISDSKAEILIADRNLVHLINDYNGIILYTDEILALTENDYFNATVEPDSAITMIYTSGTSGKPKGCVLLNRNLVAFYYNHKNVMGMNKNSRVATYASFGFDAGVMDIISAPLTGGCLYIIPDEIRLDLDAVEKFYIENEITHGFMTTQVGRMFAEKTKCKSLEAFLVGGEKLVPFNVQDSFRFINGYGPCETMAYVCHFEVTDNSLLLPIGKPNGNTKLYVVDKYGRLLPFGGIGELCISGKQVGRGYLGLPEKTAEVFVENPYCDKKGYERLYKSGDIVRYLTDGNIEYIGRRDSQVKIRGFRIELTEIEEIIRRFNGVKDATVTAFDEAGGGKFVAAYVTGDEAIDIDKLNSFIRSEKPDYMVPKITMQIDAIPYNQNQKVNRRALPKPEMKQSDVELEKPTNEMEKGIFEIACEVLGSDNFGINSNLFQCGLTSIGLLRFNSLLSEKLNINVSIADIRKNNTVKAISMLAGNDEESFEIQTEYPLMQNQVGVFLECIKNKNSVVYNIPLLLKLSKKIDLNKLKESIVNAVNAHPYIKSTLKYDDSGEVKLIRNDEAQANVTIVKADKLPEQNNLVVPFDIIGGELYRAKLFDTNDGNYLFLDFHHLISDGTSIGLLFNDINRSYDGEILKEESFSGFDASLLEQENNTEEKVKASKEYFANLLSDSSESLPERCPEDDSAEAAEFVLPLTDYSENIIDYCNDNKFSLNAFFNATFGLVLAKFLHADNATYCTIYNGRSDARLAQSFAMLVKTLPVRFSFDKNDTVKTVVSNVQNQLLDTMSNDKMPFSEIASEYSVKPDIFFNYQGDSFNFDSICGEKAEAVSIDVMPAKAPISIEVFLENGVFKIKVCYRKDCFCHEFVSSLADSISMCAYNFTHENDISQISIISENEEKHFEKMNETAADFDNVLAHKLFEKTAERLGEKIAVKDLKQSLTFKELDEKSNAVANSLIELGAKPGEIIGIVCERSVFVPVLQIGIMKAGCAFLPMLPSYPDDRISYCIKDAGCRFVALDERIIESKRNIFESTNCKPLSLEKLIENSTEKIDVNVDTSSLVYCIYTSGSTGTPKGVMIEHHNLSNFVQTSGLRDSVGKGNNLIAMASISFDMSVSEIFFTLTMGKTVYIASEEEIHNLDLLLSAFRKNDVDTMMMTPSFAWNLLSLPEFETAFANIKSIVLGAEAFKPVLFEKLRKLNPDMFIQNGYGPTECTMACSAKTLTNGKNITIGAPFRNTKFYVADAFGNLLPRYASGELLICGEGVGRGYVNLEEKTKAVFINVKGVRAYRSGDLVRINRDNEVEFTGRCDNQVKIHGFRIELDEIESVMQDYPSVEQSKILVRNNNGDDYLCGFFTASTKVDIDDLTAFMKSKLTYYMVPAAMMQLDKMPMTPNGKLDKKALPEIKVQKKQRGMRKPKKSLEEKITELFVSILNVEECFVDDNFFEIGGTSLSASKAVMQLKSDGYKIEYQDIFDHQTAMELAEFLEKQSKPAVENTVEKKNDEASENSELDELLKYNSMEYANQTVREPLGTVLLTGACGFLGAHILKTLLETEEGKIICLLRKGRYDSVVSRLQSTLVYYFEDDFKKAFESRIVVLEGDITDENLLQNFENVQFDTLINCAACVKHYANDNSIEFVNVHGVEKLIELTNVKNAKMIQISTTSVPGAHNEKTYAENLKMPEYKLFVIDDMNNQYCRSKYQAELKILEAVKNGMRGKIIRVGNLMGRYSDGEFQTNMHTNAFLNGLKGFVSIGKCPISHSTDPMSFSPIDCTAKAVVLLAGTNDMFTAFNADSRYGFDEMKIIDVLNHCGIKVTPVPDEEYYADFYRMMGDEKESQKVSALLTNDRPDIHLIETENKFTANVLYRLGFSWPFPDDAYLEKIINSLDTLDFFDWEE